MICRLTSILPLFALVLSAQSVVSTHSGVIYFFDGAVFIDNDQLLQKFGHFPELGDGRELRTEFGRAEILLTAGVILRIGENSSVRMLSNKLSDTRVELLHGSAILESSQAPADSPVKLTYSHWRVRLLKDGVSRVDSQPAQINVLSGEAEVSADDGSDPVTVRRGEVLPLASVLLTETAPAPAADGFNNWALSRSQAISEDNATASGIIDDPDKIDNSGLALGSYSYFPITGVPSLGLSNPYGQSFWSPYQTNLVSIYSPLYSYIPVYRAWPTTTGFYPGLYPRTYSGPIGITPRVGGVRPIGSPLPMPTMPPMPRLPVGAAPRGTAPAAHPVAPHVIRR